MRPRTRVNQKMYCVDEYAITNDSEELWQSCKENDNSWLDVIEQTIWLYEAAHELKSAKRRHPDEGVVDVPVTCGGGWQRRGFASSNATFTSISSNTGEKQFVRYYHSDIVQQVKKAGASFSEKQSFGTETYKACCGFPLTVLKHELSPSLIS